MLWTPRIVATAQPKIVQPAIVPRMNARRVIANPPTGHRMTVYHVIAHPVIVRRVTAGGLTAMTVGATAGRSRPSQTC